jgi:hypothetical protein
MAIFFDTVSCRSTIDDTNSIIDCRSARYMDDIMDGVWSDDVECGDVQSLYLSLHLSSHM